ncbi:MAG: DUF4032 domain-containing protein [Chloroflexota bacterium]
MRFQMVPQSKHPDFLDLPWEIPLSEWESERLVEITHGIHRHVVRFVSYDDRLYALKELPQRLAEREYRLLRRLSAEGIPVVEVVGVVTDRGGIPWPGAGQAASVPDAVLITQHLPFSLPYRSLFTGHGMPDLCDRLLDALAGLLVRLHLVNFFWGDCSLSNTLFRRDAGALAAYLVDAETGEMQPSLSRGMRNYDIEIASENIAGELLDVQAEVGDIGLDPIETAQDLERRYADLWIELTREDIIGPHERYRIDNRLHRLNELGFDVSEFELTTVPEGYRLRLEPQVVEPGHHRRRLHSLTGLHVQENQARRLLHDIERFRARIEEREGRKLPESVVVYRWLSERFEPAIAAVPAEFHGKLEPAEIYHQILEHRWFLSEDLGRDVPFDEAIKSYVESVLPNAPEEKTVFERASGSGDP